MFAHSYRGLSRTCYGESMPRPYALQKSSVLRWLQKHDDEDDEEKSRVSHETYIQVRQLTAHLTHILWSNVCFSGFIALKAQNSKTSQELVRTEVCSFQAPKLLIKSHIIDGCFKI